MTTSLNPRNPLVGWLALGMAVLAMTPGLAAAGESGLVRFTVDPMAEPVPALRYTLLHEKIDQTSGNAALAYPRVARLIATGETWNEQKEQCREWLEMPLDEFPPKAVRKLLLRQRGNLDELLKATRFDECDWELPVREEGFNTLLPHLAEMRDAARLLALDIRLLVREGDYDEAVVRLRAGMTMAGHVGRGELLIEGLVGIALADTMLDRIEEMISQPGAPNLYWALTDLPPGYLNAWQSARWERSWIYAQLPLLRHPRDRAVTADDVRRAIGDLRSIFGDGPQLGWFPPDEEQAILAAGLALAVHPRASQQLIANGRSPEEVRRMSASDVLATYLGESYATQRDNVFKWFSLPYPQARQGMIRAETDLQTAMVNDPIGSVLSNLLLPALTHVMDRFVELDRRLAALRCVEAIRAHAAAFDQKLPTSLAGVSSLPVPFDPITGTSFGYRFEDGIAHLESPKISDRDRPAALNYEIKLR